MRLRAVRNNGTARDRFGRGAKNDERAREALALPAVRFMVVEEKRLAGAEALGCVVEVPTQSE